MRKRGLLPAGLLLFLSASILAHAPSSFPGKAPGQDQPERPKFYALRVVFEKEVQNAKDSLGAPDGRYVEILPGGQLVLLMEKNFIDSGTVVCKGEENYGLEGWVQMQDTQDEQQNYAWMIIQREPSNRFIFLGGDPISGMGGYWGMAVNTVRITNPGTKSLFMDAVIGHGIEIDLSPELTMSGIIGQDQGPATLDGGTHEH
jgi:hypothetical protein